MRWDWLWRIFCIGMIAQGIIFLWLAFGHHLVWMLPYRSASLMPCCADQNCITAQVSVQFLPDEKQRLVTVNGTSFLIASGSVHHSQDGSGYWCYRPMMQNEIPSEITTVCLFYTEGM